MVNLANEIESRVTLELPSCDDRPIWDAMMSVINFWTLTIADDAGVFSSLNKAPASAQQLALELGAELRVLEPILASLASLGFLVRYQDKFHLTDVSRNFLVPGTPYYKGDVFTLGKGIAESLYRDLRKPGGKRLASPEVADNLERNPELARVLTRAMHSHSFPAAMGMALRGDFSGVTRLLDAGGGSGCFSIALALRHPGIRVTVMDVPAVRRVTEEFISKYHVEDRVDVIGRDMFNESWPTGYDAVLFSNIFHDFGWERCMRLARSTYAALEPGGRIYIHEMLMADEKDGPLPAAQFAVGMVMISEGTQYSAGELETMTREAGFADFQIMPTYGYYSLASARKP